ncbi:TPA: ester cyclase [Streptococcus suis]|nr:ester cyclase [Streptococcus suis]HEM5189890.1 ester cyclase [Streptococcus suis]HEM5210828.1 ester cyclase [Streptococcus suis]
MSNQLENAKNLYLRGIRDGEIKEVHENYMGASYTQHSTGVPDEKEGFATFFEDFFKRNPKREISIVRAIEDGNFVFKVIGQGDYVVAYSKVWIAGRDYAHFDIYRLKDGKIVEHWDNKEVMPEKKDLTNLGKF